jgi:hypothetical protein
MLYEETAEGEGLKLDPANGVSEDMTRMRVATGAVAVI